MFGVSQQCAMNLVKLPFKSQHVIINNNKKIQTPQISHSRSITRTRASQSNDPNTNNGNDTTTSNRSSPPPPPMDPVSLVQYGGTLPSPRRVALGGLTAMSIALGGNLFGITSFLLGIDGGKTASQLRLDALIPVKGYKRCVDYQNGYEFLYPASWLADQRLYQRYAEKLERQRPLDPPSLRNPRRHRSDDIPEPSAAYGPPGSNGEDNVSVIVAPIRDGFKLENMGTPTEAAERFLSSTVAPPGSDKIATLIDARARRDAIDDELYYSIEFTVESTTKGWKRHNIAVYGSRNGLLYTLNAQSSESRWSREREREFKRAAESFRILSSGAGTSSGFPDRL